MTFVRKFNGKAANSNQEPMVACYTCPEHGEFDAEVERDPNGEAPDEILCLADTECSCGGPPEGDHSKFWCRECAGPDGSTGVTECYLNATWTPSASVGCRVRRIEVTRGKWEPPERKTFLDTRKLGEGQSMDEFQAERKKVWAERRRQTVKELLR